MKITLLFSHKVTKTLRKNASYPKSVGKNIRNFVQAVVFVELFDSNWVVKSGKIIT
jgi:hypothetical protein